MKCAVHSIRSLYKTAILKRIPLIHTFHPIKYSIYSCTNTSNPSNNLLDDFEELDPDLIEELPPNTPYQSNQQTEHLSIQQIQQIQQYYQNQNSNKSDENESIESIPAPTPIRATSNLPLHKIQERQQQVWNSITTTLRGIWENMDSIDKTNVKRIDKVYKKLQKLETLHVKNIQHSLHHMAMLRDEVATVNNRINYVFKRLEDLEQISPSEWLEWTIPKHEIPYENMIYLRSPGYEVGSMIWCIELRWEIDENISAIDKDDINPIIDLREHDEKQIDKYHNDNEDDNPESDRINLGYNRLGIYVSPRSVANWERLSSLKATCEVRINENDYSSDATDNIKKQQHFSVCGEFLRGNKLTSWGRTISDGDMFFNKNKIDDEISIKLRIVNQTLSYQQYADDNKDNAVTDIVTAAISESDIETAPAKPEFSHFDFKDKTSSLVKETQKKQWEQDIEAQVQHYMTVPLNEFWDTFHLQVESGKSKDGYSFTKIAKSCDLASNLVQMFRIGPMLIEDDDNKSQKEIEKEEKNDKELRKLNSKQRERRRKQAIKQKLEQSKKWDLITEYDQQNPDFRRKLATFLVKHQYKKQRNLQTKTPF